MIFRCSTPRLHEEDMAYMDLVVFVEGAQENRKYINRVVISQRVIPKRVRNSFPALEGCGESWVGLRMQGLFALL